MLNFFRIEWKKRYSAKQKDVNYERDIWTKWQTSDWYLQLRNGWENINSSNSFEKYLSFDVKSTTKTSYVEFQLLWRPIASCFWWLFLTSSATIIFAVSKVFGILRIPLHRDHSENEKLFMNKREWLVAFLYHYVFFPSNWYFLKKLLAQKAWKFHATFSYFDVGHSLFDNFQ